MCAFPSVHQADADDAPAVQSSGVHASRPAAEATERTEGTPPASLAETASPGHPTELAEKLADQKIEADEAVDKLPDLKAGPTGLATRASETGGSTRVSSDGDNHSHALLQSALPQIPGDTDLEIKVGCLNVVLWGALLACASPTPVSPDGRICLP